MSQHQPMPLKTISQEQNVYVRYRKISRGGKNKIRSGIIERYTYKKDNGEILTTPTIHTNYSKPSVESKKCSEHISINHKIENPSPGSSNIPRTNLIATNIHRKLNMPILSSPKQHIIHEKVILPYKTGNCSQDDDDKVRTEHCDSTTDIIESVAPKTTVTNMKDEVSADKCSSIWTSQDETDSDCEIIDIKKYSSNNSRGSNNSRISNSQNRYPVSLDDKITNNSDKEILSLVNLNKDLETPKTKVLGWMGNEPFLESEPVIISDESDDESEYLCDKTGLKTVKDKLIIESLVESEIDLVSTSNSQLFDHESEGNSDINLVQIDVKEEMLSDMNLCSINCSNTSSSLQTEESIQTQSLTDLENLPLNSDLSKISVISNVQDVDPIALINAKYHRVKTQLNSEKKTTMISSPLKISSNIISMKSKPPVTCSNMLETSPIRRKSTINAYTDPTSPIVQKQIVQSPKFNAPLSPESMKSEFYSYLKINTNPSAQKAEAVAQNRRSTRVKNLILQIEKNKEQNNLKIENDEKKKDKATDIRKKFMKYSKPNIVFPKFPIEHNKASDFDEIINLFFSKELISFKSNEKETIEIIPKNKQERTSSQSSDESKDRNKTIQQNKKQTLFKIRKRMMKKKRKKSKIQKIIGCTPHISDIQLRRLRFKPNRTFRDSVRITRHSLDGYKIYNTKSKLKKAKLKAKLAAKQKKKEILKEEIKEPIVKSEDTDEINLTIKEPKLRITELKTDITDIKRKFDEIKPVVPEKKQKIIEPEEIITKIEESPVDLQIKLTQPKVTITEIKPEMISNRSSPTIPKIENKITIREVETNNKLNILPINTALSNSAEDIITVSPNNALLPNVLAKKLSIALQKNCLNINSNEKRFSLNLETLNKNKNSISNELPLLKSEEIIKIEKTVVSVVVDDKLEAETTLSTYSDDLEFFAGFEQPKEIIEEIPSPDLFGFEIDEKSLKICKTMQDIVSHLDTDILVTSSPIQTPEPIEHLVPEIRINSIPFTNEPCNLQEVISIVSSDFSSSQELTPILNDEDSSSEYSEASSFQEDLQMEIALGDIVDPMLIEKNSPNIIPFNQNIKAKSFHRSLMQTRVTRKSFLDSNRSSLFEHSDSDSSLSTPKLAPNKKSLTHGIDINAKGGAMFTSHYVNGILIIVQEFMITFWKQTALGNILGAQNMWLPNGNLQRIILERGCVNRRSSEMVLSCDNSIAYIELWTKQHESKFRECPIADVFATIYFHRGHGVPDKKVLQLENIKGYGHDVRFVVIKNSREIIVSWCDTLSKPIKTIVRSYQLAPDFQTVSSVKEMESVHHCLLSLHNIQDCDDLMLGAGNEQISVWNLRHGYLVTTLNLAESTIESPLENKTLLLYAQCDTGFLFLIQQIEVGVLRLVAVNGMTQEWKQLQSYQVPPSYKELLGIIVESGVLMTCYTNGFLCWNMSNGQILAEIEMVDNIVLPTNKYLVAFKNYEVKVQHIMSYILTHDW